MRGTDAPGASVPVKGPLDVSCGALTHSVRQNVPVKRPPDVSPTPQSVAYGIYSLIIIKIPYVPEGFSGLGHHFPRNTVK